VESHLAQVSCRLSAGEAASGGGEEAAGDPQRSAEAGGQHGSGQTPTDRHDAAGLGCVCVC